MEMCLDPLCWAINEFGEANLGDKRRSKRLARIACGVAEQPERAISASCGASGAQSVSRLMDCKEVNVDSLISAHVSQTAKRCFEAEFVLAIQDTTFLDYSAHCSKEGLGPIGPAKQSSGMLMHSVLALDSQRVPLGLLDINIWARDREEYGQGKYKRKKCVYEKESQKWLSGLNRAEQAVDANVSLLVIGDRESDIYAFFAAPRRENTDLLVRVSHNRALADGEKEYLFDAARNAKELGGYLLDVPRQGSRAQRTAKMIVQATPVLLKAPRHRSKDISDDPIGLCLVRVFETNVPKGVKALEWLLLTTLAVEDLESAVWIVRCYSARWVIEEFHRVLKEGCKVERMQFDNADRLAPAVALNAIVAWRVLHLSKYARLNPDLPALSVCSPIELKVINGWLRKMEKNKPEVVTGRDFVRAVAMLGGFLGRKSDGEPGAKTLRQGLQRLHDLVAGYTLAAGYEM